MGTIMTEVIKKSFELTRESLKHEVAKNDLMRRKVLTEWCILRDALSGEEKERFIRAAVAVNNRKYMSEAALERVKQEDVIGYEMYRAYDTYLTTIE